jgi:hypothetical protein
VRVTTLLMCLLWATGCAPDRPVGPSAPLDRAFTLAYGDAATVDATPLSLRFVRVSGDSRCPADAVCVLGGDATVHLLASREGVETALELHTGDASRASATAGPFRVTLTDLQPYPFSGRTIEPGEYRATLRVAHQES